MSDKSSFHNALYYPYADFSNIDNLAKAMLYFDKINILSPWKSPDESPARHPYMNRLQDEGVINYITPRELMEDSEYYNNVLESVDADLKDEKFKDFCKQNNLTGKNYTWSLHVDKIPFLDSARIQNYVSYPGVTDSPRKLYYGKRFVEVPYDIFLSHKNLNLDSISLNRQVDSQILLKTTVDIFTFANRSGIISERFRDEFEKIISTC